VPDMLITVDGELREVVEAATAGEALQRAGVTGAVVARVNGELRDLTHPLQAGDVVAGIAMDTADGRAVLRHSTAHVLAQAVQELFPTARLGIGPPIKDGFYYDFDIDHHFTPDDLDALAARMRAIVKEGQTFSRRVVAEEEATAELVDEPYKLELIGLKGGAETAAEGASAEVGGAELTIYDNLHRDGSRAWRDLCRGPHLPTTRHIPAFTLTRVAAAYWRGDEKNKQLQRIYGTAWESKDALKAHLTFLAEAEKRDHRKLGAELDLFSFPEQIGSGLAVFHPKGGVVRTVMEDYSRRRHEQAGYEFVYSPHITKGGLFETSGHLQWYAEGMYPPMELDGGQDYYLKPMNCPMHMLIYASRGRSYRELPMRLFEFGTVYRYEKSGVVHGLTRARGFTQDDAHIFCTPSRWPTSCPRCSTSSWACCATTADRLHPSCRPARTSTSGTPEQWEQATDRPGAGAHEIGAALHWWPRARAAFYAPKIDVHVSDAIGRRWQLSTLQVDLQLPVRSTWSTRLPTAPGSVRR
jgi:threonyl-tRNA synthetase